MKHNNKRTLMESWYNSIWVGVWRNIDKIIKQWRTPTMKVLNNTIFKFDLKQLFLNFNFKVKTILLYLKNSQYAPDLPRISVVNAIFFKVEDFQ
jgi:hypothetical protein